VPPADTTNRVPASSWSMRKGVSDTGLLLDRVVPGGAGATAHRSPLISRKIPPVESA
jgi:hypothetical protein